MPSLRWPLLLVALAVVTGAPAQDKPADTGTKADDAIARVQKRLAERLIDTKEFEGEMPLARFLEAVTARLPKDKKVALRLDADAFGKALPKVAGAPIKLPLRTDKQSLRAVLQMALSQVKDEEVDYAVCPGGVVITRPRLAAHTTAYDVHDLVDEMPGLLPYLKRNDGDVYRDLPPTDGPALLVRALMNSVELRPWETVQLRNKCRLVVLAAPARHEEVAALLDALRRMADTAVVMNARLYEVDRTFYAKHVAPLFPADEDADERPAVVPIEAPLLKTITKQKLLLESEEVKFRPAIDAQFLSQQSVFRYAAGPLPGKGGRTTTGTGTAGVSFVVHGLVSPDRRYLRLRITQEVTQLVRIDKAKRLDVSTGKDVAVEVPNVRKTSVTGTVQIPDTAPVLMPVTYRPPGKENEDKVWVLVARPFIWIEEEQQERRAGRKNVPFQSDVWDLEVPKDETPAPATPLPSDEETMALLQAVVTDVLTNPKLKETRDFYGTAKDKTFTLVDGGKLGWPTKFKPDTHGFKLVTVQHDPFVDQRRVLGISLNKFDLKQKKTDLEDTPIVIGLFNAGGSANGGVIGGGFAYYTPKRDGKRWTVEFNGYLDP